MDISFVEIQEAAMALDTEAKLKLIAELGQSIEPTEHERVWYEEAGRRRKALRNGEADTETIDVVLEKIRSQFSQ